MGKDTDMSWDGTVWRRSESVSGSTAEEGARTQWRDVEVFSGMPENPFIFKHITECGIELRVITRGDSFFSVKDPKEARKLLSSAFRAMGDGLWSEWEKRNG
jgi:hypothetical protein